jgi:hypothetical protein
MYLAMDIGCLECGELSKVLGIFKTPEQAKAVCDAADIGWRGGQHSYEVFEVEV